MKKSTKRIIALLLSLAMVAGLVLTYVYAEKDSEYKVYTILGDSFPAGYGLDTYFENAGGLDIKDGDLIEGSYPQLVAEYLTEKNPDLKVNCCAHCAWRINELLRVIDPEYDYNDGFGDLYYRALYFEDLEETNEFAKTVVPAIKEADIITIQLGTNDIYTHAINRMRELYPGIWNLDNFLVETPEEFSLEALKTLYNEVVEKVGFIKEMWDALGEVLDENTAKYEEEMPIVLDKIRELNPTADIYVLGVNNVININLDQREDEFLSLYGKSDLRVAGVSKCLKEMCDEREGFYFVSAPDAELFGIGVLDFEKLLNGDDDVKYSAVKIVHPTPEGHKYIAEQVIEMIKAVKTPAPAVTVSQSSLLKKNEISWNQVDGATLYRIYRSSSPDGEFAYAGFSFGTSYVDLLGSEGDYYKVCAVMNYTTGIVTPLSDAVNYTEN